MDLSSTFPLMMIMMVQVTSFVVFFSIDNNDDDDGLLELELHQRFRNAKWGINASTG